MTNYCFLGNFWFERGQSGSHRGQDMAALSDKRVLVPPLADGGIVTISERMPDSSPGSYGNWVEIQHTNGTFSRYAHLSTRYVSVGQTVQTAMVIGIEGSTGNSSGSHLHVELLSSNKTPIDPSPLTGVPNGTPRGSYTNDYDPTIIPEPEPPGPGPTPIRENGKMRHCQFWCYQLESDETINTPFGSVDALAGDWVIQDDHGKVDYHLLQQQRKNVYIEIGNFSEGSE